MNCLGTIGAIGGLGEDSAGLAARLARTTSGAALAAERRERKRLRARKRRGEIPDFTLASWSHRARQYVVLKLGLRGVRFPEAAHHHHDCIGACLFAIYYR